MAVLPKSTPATCGPQTCCVRRGPEEPCPPPWVLRAVVSTVRVDTPHSEGGCEVGGPQEGGRRTPTPDTTTRKRPACHSLGLGRPQ